MEVWVREPLQCDADGRPLTRKRPEPYGLKDDWLTEMRNMIEEFEARADRRRKRKKRVKK